MNEKATDDSNSKQWMSADDLELLNRLLVEAGCLEPGQSVQSATSAGDGNMNLTLRVGTDQGNLIVKQSRPWVEKYPSIPAAVERADFERRFYQAVQRDETLSRQMPRVLGYVADQYLLVLEDLGPSKDCSSFYLEYPGRQQAIVDSIEQLVPWLARLHQLKLDDSQRSQLRNVELRELNHQYIFVLPFATEPGIDLDQITPGLEAVASPLRENESLKLTAQKLGELYLADGQSLIHGDFFPGSWLNTDDGLKIIDPEFCCCGYPEFDLGVMIAHLRMTGSTKDYRALVRDCYVQHNQSELDWALVDRFSAIEVLRRLLGLAQLPLGLDLSQKKSLVEAAVEILANDD